jgi:small-conductance mechanosensitive channel
MKLVRCLIVLALLAAPQLARAQAPSLFTPPASAPPASTTPATTTPAPNADQITPAQAQQTLEVLQDDKKRAQLIETLQTIAKAVPAASSAKAPSASTKTPAAAVKAALLPSVGLGEQLITQFWDWADRIALQVGAAAKAVTDFPLVWRWVNHVIDDPDARAWALATLWKMGLVVVCGLAVEWLLNWLLRRPYRALARHAPGYGDPRGNGAADDTVMPPGPKIGRRRLRSTWQVVRRLPFAFAGLLLRAIPIVGFAVTANILAAIDVVHASDKTRLIITAVVNAYVLLRAILCVTRLLASEAYPQLSLIRMKAENAAYIEVWVRRITVLALFGIVTTEAAGLLGLAPLASMALLKVVALLVHICFVIIVLQCRRPVADAIRGSQARHGAWASLRDRFAHVWHYLAAAFIIALWFVWAIQVRDGLANLFRFIVVTAAILGVARLVSVVAIGSLDRLFHLHPDVAAKYPTLEARANRYYPLLRTMISGAIWLATIVALLEAWGLRAFSWFSHGQAGDKLVSALVTIGVAIILAIAIWEAANAAMDRHVAHLTREQQLGRVARVKTLLPILRNILLIAIIVILGLTILSQIGVNIAPLLAGAGILGVALGFGSQKLVQDLITGLFLLLENTMQVGDWVTAGGLSGSVENLSIRTMRLRAGDGSLHIIPFSAVTTVTNTNRGVGNAAVSVNVAIREDPDRVGDALKAIALDMRKDPKFGPGMLSDLQLWGVDKIDGSVMTIVGQIVCTDQGRWGVQREFNRRMKIRFEELGITIANPTQTIVMAKPDGPADTPARSKTLSIVGGGGASEASTTTTDSPPPAALGHGE